MWRTSYQLVSEPIGSRFLEEVVARQMVEVGVHSSRSMTMQDNEQTNDDDGQTRSQMWSRRVLEANSEGVKMHKLSHARRSKWEGVQKRRPSWGKSRMVGTQWGAS